MRNADQANKWVDSYEVRSDVKEKGGHGMSLNWIVDLLEPQWKPKPCLDGKTAAETIGSHARVHDLHGDIGPIFWGQ